MYTILWDIKATKALKKIFDFYKPKSIKAAHKVKDDILATVSGLKNPPKYSYDPDLGAPYHRVVSRRRYRIIYFQDSDLMQIEILYIFDAIQSPDKLKQAMEK